MDFRSNKRIIIYRREGEHSDDDDSGKWVISMLTAYISHWYMYKDRPYMLCIIIMMGFMRRI